MKLTDGQLEQIIKASQEYHGFAGISIRELKLRIESILTPPQEAGKEEKEEIVKSIKEKCGYNWGRGWIDEIGKYESDIYLPYELAYKAMDAYAAPIRAELEAAEREIESLKSSMAELGIITGEDARRFEERHNESIKKLDNK